MKRQEISHQYKEDQRDFLTSYRHVLCDAVAEIILMEG
jgi:hypothetical protein